jgi:uncharacterized protein YndB with AHSA1/START domain
MLTDTSPVSCAAASAADSRTWPATGGLKTVVTWTLTATKGGVIVRLEQSGLRPEDEPNYQGASYGWQRFVAGLERVAAGLG